MRPPRILVIRLRMVGDLVLATPALRALRRAFPDAEIDLLVAAQFAELVDEWPVLTRVHALKRGARALLSMLRTLRGRDYDFCIDLHSIPKTAWIGWLSGARWRVGFRYPDRAWAYTETAEPPAQFSEHAVATSMRLLAPLGVFSHPGRVDLATGSAAPAADALFAARFAGRRVALLHVAPSNRFKRWAPQNYAGLAEGLAARGYLPVLIGAPGDRPFAAEIAAAGTPVESLVGETTLKLLREVIRRAALYLGPDSGPAHLAATTRTPMVVLYGPTAPVTFAPYRPGVVHLFRDDLACRPCRQRLCVHGDFRCMEIGVDRALAAVDGLPGSRPD